MQYYGAKLIAQRILDSVLQLNIEDSCAEISLSIGIVLQLCEKEVCEVMEKADKAMYHAKQDGGKKYSIF